MVPVVFHNDTIYYVDKDGEQYIPVKPIVENLGLDWSRQMRKIQDTPHFNCGHMSIVAQDGKNREMLCLPVRKLTAYLYSINANKVREDLREKLIRYQNECDEVLYQYWTAGKVTKESVAAARNNDYIAIMDAAARVFNEPDNQLKLKLDKIFRREIGYSALEAAEIQLPSPRQELALNPTEIGKQLNPVLLPAKVNKLLAKAGYQHKIADKWQALPKANGLFVMLDTNKLHSDGTPIQQMKWYSSIIPVVQGLLDKALGDATGK